jgi:hypothetical protein
MSDLVMPCLPRPPSQDARAGALKSKQPKSAKKERRQAALKRSADKVASWRSSSTAETKPPLLAPGEPLGSCTIRPEYAMSAQVASFVKVAISDEWSGGDPMCWSMKLKLYLDVPVYAKHTLYLPAAACRRSQWIDLAERKAGLQWRDGADTIHIMYDEQDYAVCATSGQYRYIARIPLDSFAKALARMLVDADEQKRPFAPEPSGA